MKSATLFLAAALALTTFSPAVSRADFVRVCRGASLYRYDNEIKKAIKQKLDTAGIAFKRVEVSYQKISRPHDTYVNDFDADLTVAGGTTPAVNFTGAFPDSAPCSVSFKVRIAVVYPDGTRTVTVTPATAPGTLLPPLARRYTNIDE